MIESSSDNCSPARFLADPKTGRYLYDIPGAHGGAEQGESPLIQYDVKTRTRKVIAFWRRYYHKKYGYVPAGAFGTAVSRTIDMENITPRQPTFAASTERSPPSQ